MYVRETQMSVRSLSTKLRKSFATIIGATLVAASLVATAPANATPVERIGDNPPSIAATTITCSETGGWASPAQLFYHLGTNATADFTLAGACDGFQLSDLVQDVSWNPSTQGVQTYTVDVFDVNGNLRLVADASTPGWVTDQWGSNLAVAVASGETLRVHGTRTPSSGTYLPFGSFELYVTGGPQGQSQSFTRLSFAQENWEKPEYQSGFSYQGQPYPDGQVINKFTTDSNQGSFSVRTHACTGEGRTSYTDWYVDGQLVDHYTGTMDTSRTLTGLAAGDHTIQTKTYCETTKDTRWTPVLYDQTSPMYSFSPLITVRVSVFTPSTPVFSQQPEATQSIVAGGSIWLSTWADAASVGGYYAYVTYQWYKDGTPIQGKTDRNLSLQGLTAADAGSYWVVATNTQNGATTTTESNHSTVTVSPFVRYSEIHEPGYSPSTPTAPSSYNTVSHYASSNNYQGQGVTVEAMWYSCPSSTTLVAANDLNDLSSLSACSQLTTNITNSGSTSGYTVQSADVGRKLVIVERATNGTDTRYYRSATSLTVVAGSNGGGGGGCTMNCAPPAASYTLNNVLSGGTAAGNAASQLITSSPRPTFQPRFATGDGKGGYFEMRVNPAYTFNGVSYPAYVHVTHFNKNVADLGFTSTNSSRVSFTYADGSVLTQSSYQAPGGIGWYGDRTKWFAFIIETSNPNDSAAAGRVTFKRGTYGGAIPADQIIARSSFNSICASSYAQGWVAIPTGFIEPVSAATTEPIVSLTCTDSTGDKSGLVLVKVTTSGPQFFAKVGITDLAPSSGNSIDGVWLSSYSSNIKPTAGSAAISFAIENSHGTGQSSTTVSRQLVQFNLAGQETSRKELASIQGEGMTQLIPLNDGQAYGTYVVYGLNSTTVYLLKPAASGNYAFTAVPVNFDSLSGVPNDATSDLEAIPNSLVKSGKVMMMRNVNWSNYTQAGEAAVSVDFNTGNVVTGEVAKLTGSRMSRYLPFFIDDEQKVNYFFDTTVLNAAPTSTRIKWNKLTDNGDISVGGSVAPATPTINVPVALGAGINAGGNKITLTGTGLKGITSVRFNGVALAAGKFTTTATALTITVPAGTGTAPVEAVYSGGTIALGSWVYVGVTKLSQSITLNTGADTYVPGAAARTVTVSTVSGSDVLSLAVTVVSKTPTICAYVQGQLSFVGNGKCIVEATQPGNDAYAAANKVTKEIWVTPDYDGASTLYSTDSGKPSVTLSGTGLTSVTSVQLVNPSNPSEIITVTGSANIKPNANGTQLTVKLPDAGVLAGDTADIKLVWGPNNTTPIVTGDTFEFVGATKLNQTISFQSAASAVYGDALRNLSAVSELSDGTDLDVVVTLASKTPAVCSVTNNQLRFLSSGICQVEASQAGNAGLNKATSVIQEITVSRKAQSITIADTTLETTDAAEAISAGAELDNSELALEYYSGNEDVCTVDGAGNITGLQATNGTTLRCVITVKQPGDLRYAPAADQTLEVTITTAADPADDAPAVGDGILTPVAVANGGPNTFTATNDPGFELSWDKANGKLIPRATGVYTGFIQAKLTFTKAGVTYTCSVVFGSNAVMKNSKPAEKKAAKALKTFTTKNAFCSDPNEIKATLLTPVGGLTRANFAKIKPSAKDKKAAATVAGSVNYEKAAQLQLKNFTGTVTIEIKRFRAWPTTGVNFTGDKSKLAGGKKIPVVTRNTTVTLG
jgi:hypothetical protein